MRKLLSVQNIPISNENQWLLLIINNNNYIQ